MQIICHGLKAEDFQVEFTDHKFFLGRDATNSIVVTADGVSKYHAFFVEEGNDLFIQDNDSLNGTFLNYNQIHDRQKLVSGDIIQIGYRLIKVVFFPDQKVVLDFVPPEQTEIISNSTVRPVSPAPAQSPFGVGKIDRTVVAAETIISSTVPENSLFPGGSEIGKYVIIKRIGRGGMGEVYLAKHKTLGTYRALKVLPKDSSDNHSDYYDRFIREAKLASEIRHPNVVGVMDVETDSASGFSYIVMEYVDGGSLRNSLTVSKRLSEEQAVVIVEAVASALQAAEEYNIVHRDIKPDNIMFTKRGEVKLADLGIAKISGKDNDLTKTNMMIGTPAYLPPEQAQNAKSVDSRADIYSLGATYYEMLTGEPPYPGENTIEILHKMFLTPVPDPRKINPDVSPASAAIVMKMLAKDPKDRFQNADELLDKMERTFPLHTPGESAELIRMVIAGDCQTNASFSSSISSTILSLWWLKLSGSRKLYLAAAVLAFACCIVGVLLFFGGQTEKSSSHTDAEPQPQTDWFETVPVPENNPGETAAVPETPSVETETVPIQKSKYGLQIRTTPDSEIHLTFPDGHRERFFSDDKGELSLPELNAGRYSVTIMRDNYREANSDFKMENDMTLVLPLTFIENNDPLHVTTNLDVVDPDDGVISLREALEYVRNHNWNPIVSFADDYEIRLSSSLAISKQCTIDGEGHKITIIGPKTEPMFLIPSPNPSLKLKNLSLMSDYSGDDAGIMTLSSYLAPDALAWLWNGQGSVPSGLLELVSVKDGGKAKRLWNIEGVGLLLDGTSHLHRFAGSQGTTVKILGNAIVEDATLAGRSSDRLDGDFMVYGTLKNAVVSDYGDVYVFNGGHCENLRIGERAFVENRYGGTINGLKVEFGGVYGYERNGNLTGTVSIGGVTKAPAAAQVVVSTVGSQTDMVFDLTERNETSGFSFIYSSSLQSYVVRAQKPPHAIIDNMVSFGNAHTYSVQVKENQSPGEYILGGNAADFNSPVSLNIGNTVYPNALSLGKRFKVKNKFYTLSLKYLGEVTSKGGDSLILKIEEQ